MRMRHFLPALLLALVAWPATAGNYEIYGGYYSPDDGVFQEGLTYGVRGSWPVRDAWSVGLSVGRWEDSQSARFGGIQFPGLPPIGGFEVEFEVTLTLVDVSVAKELTPGGWMVYGGPGWAFAEADAEVRGIGIPGGFDVSDSAREDSFTVHLGFGGRFPLGERMYWRPDIRARWFTEGGSSSDLEASIALGWSL
ncbi:MAG: hypothetical protein SF066_23145 [Thermoanaerobaculia bacterium]|nr:hypothetical protein [Thermoanaerobaculia bacterium]